METEDLIADLQTIRAADPKFVEGVAASITKRAAAIRATMNPLTVDLARLSEAQVAGRAAALGLASADELRMAARMGLDPVALGRFRRDQAAKKKANGR